MSDETQLERRVRITLTDVRVLIALFVGLTVTIFGGGWVAMAQVRAEAKDAAKEQTSGLETRQAAVEANVKDLRDEVADVKAEVRELRKDLRALFPRLPAIDAGAKDGGP